MKLRRAEPTQQRAVTRLRWPAPQAMALASGLGHLYGHGINRLTGTILYGYPGIQTQRTAYAGYAFPPQLFTGYDPRKVAAGAARVTPARLPGTSSPASLLNSPLQQATATVAAAQTGAAVPRGG